MKNKKIIDIFNNTSIVGGVGGISFIDCIGDSQDVDKACGNGFGG